MKKIIKTVAGFFSAGIISLLALVLYARYMLPDNLYIAQGEEVSIGSRLSWITFGEPDIPISSSLEGEQENDGSYKLNLKLFESVPVKQVQVQVVPRNMVVPGGIPFGIKMFTQGILVVGMSDIQNGTANHNPAKDSGIKIGDVLTAIDDQPLERNDDVLYYISHSEGNEIKISLNRDGVDMDLYLKPVKSDFDNGYKAGIWVRDSSAGIGTMTYFNPETMGFAGLGHAICDVDTGDIMPLANGEIVDVNITGANIGHSGKPGELKGNFVGSGAIGKLLSNCDNGIYGVLHSVDLYADPVPMAHRQEIVPGPATILSTISGNKPQSFDIEIEKVNYADTTSTKNMVIRVTDPDLLEATGGIVQGMSGSPILQDGKLVGAVTHVFVNDPTRGYGIFAENMDKQLNSVINSRIAA